MRHVKTVLGLAVAVCAFGVTAVPAMAHQFVAGKETGKPISEEFPAKTAGKQVGEQAFKFGGLKITCEQVHAKGTLTQTEFNSFATAVKFALCTTEVKFGAKEVGHLKTSFNKGLPVTFVYHQNGFVEVGSETEEEEGEVKISGGEANFQISGLKCLVTWPAQTIPIKAIKEPEGEFSSAVYSNNTQPIVSKKFPSGFQTKLVIANEFKKLKYSVSNGACEEFEKTEGSQGSYKGTLEQEVVGGTFSFQ